MSFMYFKVWQKQYQGRGFANNIYIPFFEMRHLKIFKLFLFISIQYKKCTITYFFHPQAFLVKVISHYRNIIKTLRIYM